MIWIFISCVTGPQEPHMNLSERPVHLSENPDFDLNEGTRCDSELFLTMRCFLCVRE